MLISKISTPFQRNDNNSTRNQGVTYPKLSTLSSDTVSFSGIKPIPVKRLSRREVIETFKKDGDLNAALIKLTKIKSEYATKFSERIIEKIRENLPKELKDSITSRVKGFESTKNKIYKKYNQLLEAYLEKNGEIPSLEISGDLLSQAFGKIDDCIGVRLNISSEKKDFKEILSKLLKSSLNITQIKNYSGNNNTYYIKPKDLSILIHDNRPQIKFQSLEKESGYKAVHLIGDNFEIQIKSQRMTDFGNWEHDIRYKTEGFVGENLKAVKEKQRKAYASLDEKQKEIYHDYLTKCYDYISALDSGKRKIKPPAFPEGLDEVLKYKNFDAGKKSTENLEKTRLDNL